MSATPLCDNRTEKQVRKQIPTTVVFNEVGEPIAAIEDKYVFERLTKREFCIVSGKITGKLTKNVYNAVMPVLISQGYYPISYAQAKRAFNNFIRYGYVDGRAKDGHIERRSPKKSCQNKYNSLKDTVKVTRNVAVKALLLWYTKSKANNMTIKKIWRITGVSPTTLYKLIKEFAWKGKILGKTVCDMPGTHEPCISRYYAVEKKMPSYFKRTPNSLRPFASSRNDANYSMLVSLLFSMCGSERVKKIATATRNAATNTKNTTAIQA